MEMKEIYECQEVLDSVLKIQTEEEYKCDKLLRNSNAIKWLSEREKSS